LLTSKTLVPAAAWAERVTVQPEVPGAFTAAGEHVSPVTCVVCNRPIEADTVAPFHIADIDAVALACSIPVVAAKVAEICPTGMETLAGTVKAGLLLLSATWVALAAALFSDTVHMLDELLPSDVGAQLSDVNWAEGAARFNVNLNCGEVPAEMTAV
jgi:hypothetical protein